MTAAWQARIFLLAVITIATVWSGVPGIQAQTTFRAEAEGTHLPTFGNAYESLAEGTPGQLSVVALAEPTGESNTIAFVVRNNTPDLLIPWVTATAQSEATGETLRGRAFNPNAFPYIVEPGNLVIGEITFEQSVPIDASLEVTVTGEQPNPNPAAFILQEDLGPLWLDTYDPTTGEGIVSNPATRDPVKLDALWHRMACFEDGELQRLVLIDIDARSLAGQGTTRFRLYQAEPEECESFIFAGYGLQCGPNPRKPYVCGPERREE